MSNNLKEITINIPHLKLKALQFGDPNGPPILAAHGWLDNAASFIPIAHYLKNYNLIAVDLPGHGHSEHRPKNAYLHLIDDVVDLIAVMRELGWHKCSLLGHSMGGALLSVLAGTIPEQITHLGLIDILGPLIAPASELPKLLYSATHQYPKLNNKRLPKYNSIKEAIQARLNAAKMDESSAKLIIDRGLQQLHDGYVWRTDPKLLLKPLFMFSEEQANSFLTNIKAKTCLLYPDNGWEPGKILFPQRIKLVKNITVHNIEGRHHVHMDDPAITGKILNEFFSS